MKDFGQSPYDEAMVAESNEKIIGAVWCCIIGDYGHIDDETPSLAMPLLPAYRGQGIGTKLLKTFLKALRMKGYRQIPLSVQKDNDACGMY